jgi:uncharacterized membrane protein YeaQ/YmgE (transglycosylase-associated protein family)
MNVIPWFADMKELSTVEMTLLLAAIFVGAFFVGIAVDMIMKDTGLGAAPNGIIALIGAFAGVYLRYRLLNPFRADDLILTIGFAIGCAMALFLLLGWAKCQIR